MLDIRLIRDVPANQVDFLKSVAMAENAVKADSFPQPDGKVTLVVVYEKKEGAVGVKVADAAAQHGATVLTA